MPPVIQTSVKFSTYIFSADIIPDMLKLCRVTKVKVLSLVLVYVFNFNLFEFSAATLEKGLLPLTLFIKPNILFYSPPTQHHSFLRN